MRLNDPLITSFKYKGKEYQIDLAFDNVLDVFDVLEDNYLRDYEKADICLNLLLDEQKNTTDIEMWNYIFENFIQIGKQEVQYDIKGNPVPVAKSDDDKELIDVEQDAKHIYASFKQAYGINLFEEQGKMHWFEFQSLLNGLPSDTVMQRIIQIRAWKPEKGDSSKYKSNMRKLQKQHALKGTTVDETDSYGR